jgi:hypothetical protein
MRGGGEEERRGPAHARRMPGKAENVEVSAVVVQRGSVEVQADEPLQDWEELH